MDEEGDNTKQHAAAELFRRLAAEQGGTEGGQTLRRAAIAIAMVMAASGVTPAQELKPADLQEAVAQARTLPPQEADRESVKRFHDAVLAGKAGVYPLEKVAACTTPFSRAVWSAYVSLEETGKPVVDVTLLKPELHVYVAPVGRFSKSTTDLLVVYIRPAGDRDPNRNAYPTRVEATTAGEREYLRWLGWDDAPIRKAIFPLSELRPGRELVTVFDGVILPCQGPVCIEPLRSDGVR